MARSHTNVAWIFTPPVLDALPDMAAAGAHRIRACAGAQHRSPPFEIVLRFQRRYQHARRRSRTWVDYPVSPWARSSKERFVPVGPAVVRRSATMWERAASPAIPLACPVGDWFPRCRHSVYWPPSSRGGRKRHRRQKTLVAIVRTAKPITNRSLPGHEALFRGDRGLATALR
jgi:hypothetical protein